MKFLLWMKALLVEYKAIAIGIAVIFSLALGGILISPASQKEDKPAKLAQKTEAKPTENPEVTSTEEPKTQSTIQHAVKTPTKTPSVTSTLTPTSVPSSNSYSVNGVTFSSLYPTVSLKPGEQKAAFAMTAGSKKNFEVYDTRVIGSSGLSFSPLSGTIEAGQTKEVIISANPDAATGIYGGFIGVKIDGVYPQQPMRITVTVEGNGSNSQSLKLTGPAGGSTYNVGDDIAITWEATNISGDFDLSVEGENGDTYSFASVGNGERKYIWKAQKWFAPNATHFRFTITGGGFINHSASEITIN